MGNLRVKLAAGVAIAGIAATTASAVVGNRAKLQTKMRGYEEVPAVSTTGNGSFKAQISRTSDEIKFELRYADLEGAVTQAHIHFGQRSVSGSIVVWLCGNVANAPAGTQPCPAAPATVTGTITPANVTDLAASQGIASGEFDELVRALRSGVAYANVHSAKFPAGEIRGQLTEHRNH